MMVGELMKTGVVAVSPHMAWRDAALLLFDRRLSCVPVVNARGDLIGILSEKDLFRGIFPSFREWIASPELYVDFSHMEERATDAAQKTVADVMTTHIISAEPTTPILKVGAHMVASGVHHVPVLEHGKLVGMIGRGDIYRAILRQYFGFVTAR